MIKLNKLEAVIFDNEPWDFNHYYMRSYVLFYKNGENILSNYKTDLAYNELFERINWIDSFEGVGGQR